MKNVETICLSTLGVLGAIIFASRRRAKQMAKTRAAIRPYSCYPSTYESEADGGAKIIVITGGAGFVGSAILRLLLQSEENIKIIVFDAYLPPKDKRDPRVTYIQGDIRVAEHCRAAFRGAHTIFHTCSIIPLLGIDNEWMRSVNCGGTKVVLDTCLQLEIPRLVYTSSASVVMGKNDYNICNVDEGHPYPKQPIDYYAQTKQEAEIMVLKYNGIKFNSGNGHMMTCVVRPTAIYGPGDKLISDNWLKGRDLYYIGDGESLIDFVHVDSVAHGHIVAGRYLPGIAEGQSYFIGNGKPTKYKTMVGVDTKSFNQKKGYSHWNRPLPKRLPLWLVILLAKTNELWCWVLGFPLFSPVLCQSSLCFLLRTWYFNSEKAMKQLGYQPIHDGDLQTTLWEMASIYEKSQFIQTN